MATIEERGRTANASTTAKEPYRVIYAAWQDAMRHSKSLTYIPVCTLMFNKLTADRVMSDQFRQGHTECVESSPVRRT